MKKKVKYRIHGRGWCALETGEGGESDELAF